MIGHVLGKLPAYTARCISSKLGCVAECCDLETCQKSTALQRQLRALMLAHLRGRRLDVAVGIHSSYKILQQMLSLWILLLHLVKLSRTDRRNVRFQINLFVLLQCMPLVFFRLANDLYNYK